MSVKMKITHSNIAKVINCPNYGMEIRKLTEENGYNKNITRLLFSKNENTRKTTNLLPKYKAWFRIIMICLIPKELSADNIN